MDVINDHIILKTRDQSRPISLVSLEMFEISSQQVYVSTLKCQLIWWEDHLGRIYWRGYHQFIFILNNWDNYISSASIFLFFISAKSYPQYFNAQISISGLTSLELLVEANCQLVGENYCQSRNDWTIPIFKKKISSTSNECSLIKTAELYETKRTVVITRRYDLKDLK